MPFIVGLTGGIGSGKSTVAELFAQLGAAVVDTDQIAHELTRPGMPVLDTIAREVGPQFIHLDGSLDRRALRKHVFAHPSARKSLESVLHPLILREARLLANQQTAPYVLVVVPLLFESGQYREWIQRTLVTDCPETLQIERTTQRSGLAPQEIREIMATQLPRQERLALADDIISNSLQRDNLIPQVEGLHQRYLQMAAEWQQRHL